MATLSASLQMHDRMSAVLNNIVGSLNIMVSTFQDVQTTAAASVDTANWEAARQSVINAGAALQQYNESIDYTRQHVADPISPNIQTPEPAAPTWQSVSTPEIFMSTGAERFASEFSAADAAMQQVYNRQMQITQAAQRMDITPPGMLEDVNAVQNRMQVLQQRVQQLNNIPINLRTDAVNRELESIRGTLADVGGLQDDLNDAISRMDFSAANQGYRQINGLLDGAERGIRDNVSAQEQFNQAVQQGTASISGMGGRLKGLIATYASFRGLQGLTQMSDGYSQMVARVGLMNDGMQSTAQLTQMIYESAQRSRGSFTDTADAIAKMGLNAGNAFSSNTELIAFMEQVNKQFVIGGASAQQQSDAMLQLSQAMAAGALRGEELNSILDAAPGIARTIERSMGWAEGSIKQYAEKGEVTAQVVKRSLLSMAGETNASFESMPLTWSQAMQQIKNAAYVTFIPVMEKINAFLETDTGQAFFIGMQNGLTALGSLAGMVVDTLISGANWVVSNWDRIVPALTIAALTLGSVMVASALSSAVAWVVAAWPLLLIIGIIAAVVAAVYVGVDAFNALSGSAVSATGLITGTIGVWVTWLSNKMKFVWNTFADLGNFIGNVFKNPIAAIVIQFYDMKVTVLGFIAEIARGIQDLLNAIPGVEVDLTSGIDNLVSEYAAKSEALKDNVEWTEYFGKLEYSSLSGGFSKGYEMGQKLENTMNNFFKKEKKIPTLDVSKFAMGGGSGGFDSALGDIGNNTGGTAANTAAMADTMDIMDEDLKYMRDAAEQEIINRFTLAELKLDINNNNTLTTKTDFDEMSRQMANYTGEFLAAAAEGGYF